MSNSRENVVARRLHGKFADQVMFRTRNGKSITANIPKLTGVEITATATDNPGHTGEATVVLGYAQPCCSAGSASV